MNEDFLSEMNVIKLAGEIDEFIAKCMLDYSLGPNGINGVILARLIKMNEEVNNMDNIKHLMESIIDNSLLGEHRPNTLS